MSTNRWLQAVPNGWRACAPFVRFLPGARTKGVRAAHQGASAPGPASPGWSIPLSWPVARLKAESREQLAGCLVAYELPVHLQKRQSADESFARLEDRACASAHALRLPARCFLFRSAAIPSSRVRIYAAISLEWLLSFQIRH
jgi:hypothetical protein